MVVSMMPMIMVAGVRICELEIGLSHSIHDYFVRMDMLSFI